MTFLEKGLADRGLTLETATPEEIDFERREIIENVEGYGPDDALPIDNSFTCCICGKHYDNTPSCGATPITEGECCPVCNELVVCSARTCFTLGLKIEDFVKSAYLMMPGLRRALATYAKEKKNSTEKT